MAKRIVALDLETNSIHTVVEYDFKTGKCILRHTNHCHTHTHSHSIRHGYTHQYIDKLIIKSTQ